MAGNNIKNKQEAFKKAVETHPMRNDIITYLNTVGVATQEQIVEALKKKNRKSFSDSEDIGPLDTTVVEFHLDILSSNSAGIQALQEKNTRRLKANLDFLGSEDLSKALEELRMLANEDKYVHTLYEIVKKLEKGEIYPSHTGANDIPTSEKNITAALHAQENNDPAQSVVNTKLNKMMKKGYLTNPHTRIDHKKENRQSKRQTGKTPTHISEEEKQTKMLLSELNKNRAKNILDLLNEQGPQTMTDVMIKMNYEQSVTSQHLIAMRKAGLLSERKGESNARFHYYRVNVETIQFIDKMIKEITGKDETRAKDDFTRIEEQFNDDETPQINEEDDYLLDDGEDTNDEVRNTKKTEPNEKFDDDDDDLYV